MDKNQKNNKDYYTIDMMHIMKSLWNRLWIVILAGILAAGAGFSIAAFAITPEYSASILLYVNNSSFSVGGFEISAADLTASQSLVKTYTELLKNRTTLERVIEKTGVNYTYADLYGMIQAGSSHETEVMKVTVTCEDPYIAAKIANCIAEVLPIRINEIIEGASMRVVDSAIPNPQKVSPSITQYTAIGLAIGVLISALVIALFAMLDDTIHDEDYVIQTYDYPILAKVPDLLGQPAKGYGYRYYKKSEYKAKQ